MTTIFHQDNHVKSSNGGPVKVGIASSKFDVGRNLKQSNSANEDDCAPKSKFEPHNWIMPSFAPVANCADTTNSPYYRANGGESGHPLSWITDVERRLSMNADDDRVNSFFSAAWQDCPASSSLSSQSSAIPIKQNGSHFIPDFDETYKPNVNSLDGVVMSPGSKDMIALGRSVIDHVLGSSPLTEGAREINDNNIATALPVHQFPGHFKPVNERFAGSPFDAVGQQLPCFTNSPPTIPAPAFPNYATITESASAYSPSSFQQEQQQQQPTIRPLNQFAPNGNHFNAGPVGYPSLSFAPHRDQSNPTANQVPPVFFNNDHDSSFNGSNPQGYVYTDNPTVKHANSSVLEGDIPFVHNAYQQVAPDNTLGPLPPLYNHYPSSTRTIVPPFVDQPSSRQPNVVAQQTSESTAENFLLMLNSMLQSFRDKEVGGVGGGDANQADQSLAFLNQLLANQLMVSSAANGTANTSAGSAAYSGRHPNGVDVANGPSSTLRPPSNDMFAQPRPHNGLDNHSCLASAPSTHSVAFDTTAFPRVNNTFMSHPTEPLLTGPPPPPAQTPFYPHPMHLPPPPIATGVNTNNSSFSATAALLPHPDAPPGRFLTPHAFPPHPATFQPPYLQTPPTQPQQSQHSIVLPPPPGFLTSPPPLTAPPPDPRFMPPSGPRPPQLTFRPPPSSFASNVMAALAMANSPLPPLPGVDYTGRQSSSSLNNALSDGLTGNDAGNMRSMKLTRLRGHYIEIAQSQYGSRLIQHELEGATPSEKTAVFREVLPKAADLMVDAFGNFVIQKFFEVGTIEQKMILTQQLHGLVVSFSLQMYACRVIQKAIEYVPLELQLTIVKELDGSVIKCIKDQNGNHVVQKCIEFVPARHLQFIVDSFEDNVLAISTHSYGCRVIQRVLEHCLPEQTAPILRELHANTDALVKDQYGNYVIQHVLEHGLAEDRSRIIQGLLGNVADLSMHKFASNVVEKAVSNASTAQRYELVAEVLNDTGDDDPADVNSQCDSERPPEDEIALCRMMKDQFANYVVQTMLDVSEPSVRQQLVRNIWPHLHSLVNFTYGKRIISKLTRSTNRSHDHSNHLSSKPSFSDCFTLSRSPDPSEESSSKQLFAKHFLHSLCSSPASASNLPTDVSHASLLNVADRPLNRSAHSFDFTQPQQPTSPSNWVHCNRLLGDVKRTTRSVTEIRSFGPFNNHIPADNCPQLGFELTTTTDSLRSFRPTAENDPSGFHLSTTYQHPGLDPTDLYFSDQVSLSSNEALKTSFGSDFDGIPDQLRLVDTTANTSLVCDLESGLSELNLARFLEKRVD